MEISFVKFLHWVNVQRTYSRGLCCWLAEGLNVRVLEGRGSKTAPKRFLTQSGQVDWYLESVQDFFDQVWHLLELSTFSLNNVILRLTKIMNKADKNWAHF